MQSYEESVSFLGTWGPFQRRVFFLLCLSSAPSGFNILSPIFLLASPSHHCLIPTHSNLSQDWVQASIPVQGAGGAERSSCSQYDLDQVMNLSAAGVSPSWILNPNQSVLEIQLQKETCEHGWNYDTEYFQSTVVTEFGLVCKDGWKQPLSSFFYFFGGICGCLISGPIADRFGRKPVLFCGMMLISIFSIAVAFAPSWPVFTVLYYILGIGQIATFIVAYVLGSEILIGSPRVYFSSLAVHLAYLIATMLLVGSAYLVRTWRHLSVILAVPGLLCLPLWWFIPESPRWLLSRGRWQEAELLLRSAARDNSVEPPSIIFTKSNLEKEENQESESYTILDLLRSPSIRYITLILWVIWFSGSMAYFGVSFNLSSISGNPYLNYFLLSLVEIPAYVANWLAVCRFPRGLTFISFTLLGALALLLIQVAQTTHPAVTLCLVLLGRFGILGGSTTMYVYSGELSPTVIRNTAMSSCAMLSRMGSCVAPYLMQLAVVNQFLPWIVVGLLSLLSVVLSIFLPETFKQPLPDTIQEMAHKQRFRWPWTSTPSKDNGELPKDETMAPEIICTTHL